MALPHTLVTGIVSTPVVCGFTLAVELINEIVGYAALLDSETLFSVSLVCKWWADTSFRVAHREIVVDGYVVQSGKDSVEEESHPFRQRIDALEDFVYLPQYVRGVTFRNPGVQRRVRISVRGFTLYNDHLHNCHVRRTLRLLPLVDVLKLEGLEWRDCGTLPTWDDFPKRAFKVLMFSDMKILAEESHPAAILRAATSVDHLIMGYERGSIDVLQDTSQTPLRRVSLHHLGAGPDHRFDVLSHAQKNTLVHLDVNSVAPHNIPHMRVLLLGHALSLQRLEMSFYLPDSGSCYTFLC